MKKVIAGCIDLMLEFDSASELDRWGYAIHTSDNRWVYFINAKRFAEIEGITV